MGLYSLISIALCREAATSQQTSVTLCVDVAFALVRLILHDFHDLSEYRSQQGHQSPGATTDCDSHSSWISVADASK